MSMNFPEDRQVVVAEWMQMARQRTDLWAPQRLGRVLWSILRNLRGQMELFRIFSLPAFKTLAFRAPFFLFRHHARDFLFRGSTAKQRTVSILHHYRFLISRMSHYFSSPSGHGTLPLIEHRKNGRDFAVTLGLPPRDALLEGESLLQLLVDGVPIYHLQFTIVPGWVLNSERPDVIFVQRIQGVKGCFQEINAATKALNDIAPPLLLVSVLQGIAAAWGVRELACISAKSQYTARYYNDESSSARYRQIYDEFLLELGATRVSSEFFSLSLPISEKPIELIGNGHKSRTRRKRAFRHEIANRVCQTILAAA
jgi:uncharacterized protein VirK/YbjX